MKKDITILIVSFFVLTAEVFSQNQIQPIKRRDCSFVGRPTIGLSNGVVIGKALKIDRPRLNKKTKRFAQNTVVIVKIEIDENGKVIAAKADGKIPILLNVSEQAARKTIFSPSMVEGKTIKIKGQIFYKFYQGKSDISYSFEPIKYEPTPIDYDWFKLTRIFESKIVSAVKDFREGKSLDSYTFIKNGQAEIQLCMATKTPVIVEKIKQTGFVLLEETQGNGLVGNISVTSLEKLVDIEEIRFIVPEMP